MGGRQVWIYDIAALKEALEQGTEGKDVVVWQKRESSLKFMTRAVKAMPTDQGKFCPCSADYYIVNLFRAAGYTTTSIEGRVAVEFFDPSPEAQAKKYAFKCHRQVIEGVDTVYPVQGLAFNPVYGTFATGGGDCTVSIWDPLAKKRLRQFPKYPSPISALEFNCDGTKLAVAFSVRSLSSRSGARAFAMRPFRVEAAADLLLPGQIPLLLPPLPLFLSYPISLNLRLRIWPIPSITVRLGPTGAG